MSPQPPLTVTGDRRPLRLVFTGRVDHGKSTLLARLLADLDRLPIGRVAEARAASARRGTRFEWSYVLDALQAERDQAVTIETTRIRLQVLDRAFILMDVPGHRQFLRNAVVGLAEADAAVIVADAAEDPGEIEAVAGLLAFFGIANIVVALNKMDRIDREAQRFASAERQILEQLARDRLQPRAVVPIVAQTGENLVQRSTEMPWYVGPTLLEALATLPPPPAAAPDAPLRFPVQDVYRIEGRRFVAGRVESGRVGVGDRLVFLPRNQEAEVAAIRVWDEPDLAFANAGRSCALLLREDIFVERGDLASHRHDRPPVIDRPALGMLFPEGDRPRIGQPYRLQSGTAAVDVEIVAAEPVPPGDGTWQLTIRSERPMVLDTKPSGLSTARCLLLDASGPVAAGFVLPDSAAGTAGDHHTVLRQQLVTRAAREARNGHRGAVLWLTGRPGAGKSTLAALLERRLFESGIGCCVLDGDALRHGLSADLGFSRADRAENIRRVAEVAALMADSGLVAIVALVSPFAADRGDARRIVGADFHEVFVAADLATCERRDPKGLYRLARAGRIADFTGISSPYEPPAQPELLLDTVQRTREDCLAALLHYASGVVTAAVAHPTPAAHEDLGE